MLEGFFSARVEGHDGEFELSVRDRLQHWGPLTKTKSWPLGSSPRARLVALFEKAPQHVLWWKARTPKVRDLAIISLLAGQRSDAIRKQQAAGRGATRPTVLAVVRAEENAVRAFVTLTIPHLPEDTVAERIERLRTVWKHFLKLLNAYLRERVICRVQWYRVVEWTIGEADQRGNPHIHMWLFSPFLPYPVLREFLVRALAIAACDCSCPVLHIQAVKDPHGGAHELIKYLTKDITANGDKVPPDVYAQVLAAFEGHRMTQCSRGFLAPVDKAPTVCECGSTLPRRVRTMERNADP
jgi:hypothetical protein